ncbi:hypothetical protein MASR1M107_30790 [Ignavibacteriales bacterium]
MSAKKILFLILISMNILNAQWFWQNPVPNGDNLHDVYFIDSLQGWTVGSMGTVFRTTDGGESWVQQQSGKGLSLSSAFFTDPRHGWIAGNKGTLLYTSNSGRNWDSVSTGTGVKLTSVWFTDSQTGYVVVVIAHNF